LRVRTGPLRAPSLQTRHRLRRAGEDYLHWDQFLEDASLALEAAPTRRDDVAFWLWTSGSTGRPKAAVHLHGDWIYCCECYARGVLDIRPDDITFSSKLFHAYGLGNGLMFPFHVGATTVVYPASHRRNRF
jgi:benzoate-CoA ligase